MAFIYVAGSTHVPDVNLLEGKFKKMGGDPFIKSNAEFVLAGYEKSEVPIYKTKDDYERMSGNYIMKITFPETYPFNAPSFQFLTPNGKFEINSNICLSNSSYHNETWSPLWGIDQIIMGTISMFYEKNTSGIGHIKYDQQQITKLAKQSDDYNKSKLASIYSSFMC